MGSDDDHAISWPPDCLARRVAVIVQAHGDGGSVQDIARMLHVSPKIVESYVTTIYRDLRVLRSQRVLTRRLHLIDQVSRLHVILLMAKGSV